MIADLKPYPSMKDSGVEWLGEMPEHWELAPGRHCFSEDRQPNVGMVEKTVLSLSYGKIVVKPEEKLRGLVPESFETYQVVDPGNIICRPTDLQNDHTSLRFGISNNRGIITSAYMCFGTRKVLDARFGYLLLHAYDLKKIFYGLGSGLRQNLSWKDFKYLPCTLPPLPEQAAIVRYLDHVERRVRRFVRAKQKLIGLLEEQKQAIIHRAVTRGLDPDVPLKDSGVEWLGEVPEHWEVRKLGHLIKLTTGFPFKSEGFSQSEGDIRLLRGVNVSPGQLRWDAVVRWSGRDRQLFSEFELLLGDVVLGMDRPIIRSGIRVASVTEADVPSLLLQRVARIRPREDLDERLLLLILAGQGFRDYLTPIFTGISVPHFSPEQIRSFLIALPPLPEQSAIIERLDEATTDIAGAINSLLYGVVLALLCSCIGRSF